MWRHFAALAWIACGTPPAVGPRPPQQLPAGHAADVDPWIGTGRKSRGNVFPGATLPFAMVKLGPDVVAPNASAGYAPSGPLSGFSHLHTSGAGGAPKYGVISLMPAIGALDVVGYSARRRGETARVGYYGVELDGGIRVELTSTRRVGIHRYTFPASDRAHVLIDVSRVLRSTSPTGQVYDGGEILLASDRQVRGYGRYRGGWNQGAYRVFFCTEVDTPARDAGSWKRGVVSNARTQTDDGAPVGAYLAYATRAGQAITVKVGISFIDAARACDAIKEEAPHWDFDAVVRASVASWNEALARIEIEGASSADRTIFYTALYHCHLTPTDRTGDNPGWQSSEPYYDDYYAIWDTFRTLHPLLALIQPQRQRDMVRSLVDIYRHDGYLPDARAGNVNGRTQGGSNADIVIADAFVKQLPDIDWTTAYAAMTKNAEVEPPDPIKHGRGGLADYHGLGYVSTRHHRSASRTVEYAANDFAIAQVARGLGKLDDVEKYRRRAASWENLWDDSVVDRGVRGFIRPRGPDGRWHAPFTVHDRGTWTSTFYETDSWEYSFYAPHDVRRLIGRAGGPEAFVRRLDTLFDAKLFRIQNEPGFLIPYLYLWAGRPDRTADRVREILRTRFRTGPDGLPGNDDSGAMSAWYVWSAIGLYPNAGQDVYLIGSPSFPRATIRLGGGKSFVIEKRGSGRYVQSATLDGQSWNRAWLRHADVARGSTLVLEMGDRPSGWGAVAPPSMSDP